MVCKYGKKTNRDELTYYNFDIEKKYLNTVEGRSYFSGNVSKKNPDSVKCVYVTIL
jgi:hypothetical protein